MRVICAPDKFKGSLSSLEAAQAMAAGVRQVRPDAQVDLCPVADGGEGFVEAIASATGATLHHENVRGPRGQNVSAEWAMISADQTHRAAAVIEMSSASGLQLIEPAQQNPMLTTTFGTGQLMHAALEHGAQQIIMGIGGSATSDGGTGAAQAMGVRFYDKHNQLIDDHLCGGRLLDIARIDMSQRDARLAHCEVVVASDVTNPLTGPDGAAAVYAPQKGASAEQVRELDQGLVHLAQLLRAQLGKDVEHVPGAGGAGGLGAGMMAFFDAQLRPGIDVVLDAVRFAQRVRGCELCLTGEGSFDGQSLSGKACMGVAQVAKAAGCATVALVGRATDDARAALAPQGALRAYHVIAPEVPAEQSMRNAAQYLQAATARVVEAWPK